MEFANKAVIVTGSSGGIGRAAALAFAKKGASLTIHGQNAAKLGETKALLMREAGLAEAKIVCVLGPIQEAKTAMELVDKTLKAFGKIDVLVNNAGLGQKPGEPNNLSLDNYDYLFDVNVRSVVQLTDLAAPHLAKTKGAVVNISSQISVTPTKGLVFYAMTKAALDHYTRDMANVLGAKGIRVNSVNPGLIPTDFHPRRGADYFEKAESCVVPNTIAKRVGTVDEVANVIAFVASDKASYMWGSLVFVDGGYTSMSVE